MEEEIKKEESEEIKDEETKEGGKDEKAKGPKGPEDLDKPLDKMTAPELRDVAMGIGFTGVHAMKKEELLSAIKEKWGIKDEEPAKKRPGKVADISALKKKIVQLKAEKKSAQEGKDKRRVNILRRRINRLKKMTRQKIES